MGDAATFQELVLTHLSSLYSYARLLTDVPGEAEDLLQDALLRGFEHFDSFDSSLSFKPWMFTILKRLHIDRYRRRRAWSRRREAEGEAPAALSEDPLDSVPLVPDDILLRRETIEQVQAAMRRLPPWFREVVELRDVEGLSYQEIAAIIQRPVGTVMSRLYRGRNLLRTDLIELGGPAARRARVRHEL